MPEKANRPWDPESAGERLHGGPTDGMFEVPGERLRELGEAERERDRLRSLLALARDHISPAKSLRTDIDRALTAASEERR